LIAQDPSISRQQISKRFCEHAGWRKPDGGLKDMSCKVAMLRMAADGIIRLPPPKNPQGRADKRGWRTPAVLPQAELDFSIMELATPGGKEDDREKPKEFHARREGQNIKGTNHGS
jgi:hypothetical protein